MATENDIATSLGDVSACAMITVVTVLQDGRHVIHQTDALPGHVSGVLVGAHLALRGHHYGDQVRRFVVIDRESVTEHDAGGAS